MSLDDQQFLDQFFSLQLPPAEFGHLGHLRLGWLLLQRHAYDEAVVRLCDGIRAYATHLGAAGKFNRTLTEAILRLMAAGGAQDRGLDWPAFLAANRALRDDARGALARHYSPAQLARSLAAPLDFIEPDLAVLPAPTHAAGVSRAA